jgi:hypothetical protein
MKGALVLETGNRKDQLRLFLLIRNDAVGSNESGMGHGE